MGGCSQQEAGGREKELACRYKQGGNDQDRGRVVAGCGCWGLATGLGVRDESCLRRREGVWQGVEHAAGQGHLELRREGRAGETNRGAISMSTVLNGELHGPGQYRQKKGTEEA